MRVYYNQAEYAPNKHRILAVWSPKMLAPRPEDTQAINVPYAILEVDEDINRVLAREIDSWTRTDLKGHALVDKFYIDSAVPPAIHWTDTDVVVVIVQNPNKADWVASVLAGATDAQIDTWFANNVTTLAQARTTMAMMAKLIARLARQAGFE